MEATMPLEDAAAETAVAQEEPSPEAEAMLPETMRLEPAMPSEEGVPLEAVAALEEGWLLERPMALVAVAFEMAMRLEAGRYEMSRMVGCRALQRGLLRREDVPRRGRLHGENDAQEKAERDRRCGENARDDEGLSGVGLGCPRHDPILSLPVAGARMAGRSRGPARASYRKR